jgi:hypothetical protein
MSIEVLDGPRSARSWKDAYGDSVTEAALGRGALFWDWRGTRWGVVFEVAFRDEDAWDVFRALPAVRAALDAVPDPVNGLLIYRGRGGTAGRPAPRKPRPLVGAGAVALPEPTDRAPHVLVAVGAESATNQRDATAVRRA